MQKQQVQAYLTLFKIVATASLVVALYYTVPHAKQFESLSSDDVEDLLYQRIDDLNYAVTSDARLARITVAAVGDSIALSAVDRQRLLEHERFFYDSWEVAWSYHDLNVLGLDSWDKWNSWFVEEAKHRPEMGWRENRQHFSGDFASHVEGSLPQTTDAAAGGR